MNRVWLVAVTVGLTLAGSQEGRAAADPATVGLDQDFVLSGGQDASIGGEDLRVRFTDVLEDSRCPALVQCFWTGQARPALLVQPHGGVSSTVVFNTNPAPGQNVSSARVNEYAIEMQSLEPYPRTPDDAPSLEEYRVTLSVTKD